MIQFITADNIEYLKTLTDNSVHAIVTDPPYGIGFMGKEWDTFKTKYLEEKLVSESKRRPLADARTSTGFQNSVYAGTYDLSLSGNMKFQQWFYEISVELFRVLKPGGYFLSFCGCRTYHRMASAIEDAGFEIRDQMQWVFGSGFPKSLNVEKAGAGKEWKGWGTALKPANEPICVARKPLEKGLTVAQNVLKYGTGAVNIDGCRISLNGEEPPTGSAKRVFANNSYNEQATYGTNTETNALGRFPANIIFDEAAAKLLDEQTGTLTSGAMKKQYDYTNNGFAFGKPVGKTNHLCEANEGGASRFFYCAKASKSERNKGLENMVAKKRDHVLEHGQAGTDNPFNRGAQEVVNHHPTVKPIKLMQYLVRLVTPTGGTVIDPFAGSGTTGIACNLEGFDAILIDREEEYTELQKHRCAAWEPEKEPIDNQLSIF